MNVHRLHARDVHERVRPDRVEFHTVRARVRVCNQRSQTDASFRLTHVTCQGVAEGIGRGEGNSTGQVLPLYPPASKAADGGLRRHRGKADTLAAVNAVMIAPAASCLVGTPTLLTANHTGTNVSRGMAVSQK